MSHPNTPDSCPEDELDAPHYIPGLSHREDPDEAYDRYINEEEE